MSEDDKAAGEASAKGCPICGKPASEKYRPFCSSRCADVDLHRWLTGNYAIPGGEDDDEDGEEAPLAPSPPRGR